MKKLCLLLCLLLILPGLAAAQDSSADLYPYPGDMEVVNCEEWVSLREEPNSTSLRLIQVPLGAVVYNCQPFADDWLYVEYSGCGGYILSRYLRPCASVSPGSAMLVTNCATGAPFYPSEDKTGVPGMIPVNTIIRNCTPTDSGMLAVEYDGKHGYLCAEHAQNCIEVTQWPETVILPCSLYAPSPKAQRPALWAARAEGFALSAYDFGEYVQEDAGAPLAEFVLYTNTYVSHVHLFRLELQSMDTQTGKAVFEAELVHTQPRITSSQPLSVTAAVYGDVPGMAVGYTDAQGGYHFAFMEISGEDGAPTLREF